MARAERNTVNSVNFIDPKAAKAGTLIAIQLTKGNYEACHKIIDEVGEEAKKFKPSLGEAENVVELNLSQRWINALDRKGYVYIEQLTEEVIVEIAKLPNVGPVGYLAITNAIREYQEAKSKMEVLDEGAGSPQAG